MVLVFVYMRGLGKMQRRGRQARIERSGKTYASITWTTPLETSTSGLMTLALLTKTVPLEMVMVKVSPFMAVSLVPFMRLELYPMAPLLPVLFTTDEQ